MKILDCGLLTVCTDCAQLVAYDEATETHRAAFKAWQDEYGDDACLILGDDETFLSERRCDGCGSTIAGSRREAFALVKDA